MLFAIPVHSIPLSLSELLLSWSELLERFYANAAEAVPISWDFHQSMQMG